MQYKNPSTLLPLQFGNLTTFRKLTWNDFKGNIDQNMPWSAHIYWNIDYNIINYQKRKVVANLYINKNSWVRDDRKSQHLLNHQQGHYLIGALCILQFLRRIDNKKANDSKKFQDLVFQTFDRTMKQYLQIERNYDNQTQHRMNFKKQLQWDQFIYNRLVYYLSIFDKKKNKFVKLKDKILLNEKYKIKQNKEKSYFREKNTSKDKFRTSNKFRSQEKFKCFDKRA